MVVLMLALKLIQTYTTKMLYPKTIQRKNGLPSIFLSEYEHYISLYNVVNSERLFIDFVHSDDIKGSPDDVYWDNDTIVITTNDFSSNYKKLQKIEITDNSTVFYFPEGYATK